MISTDFAPNETWRDAFASIKMLLTPWRWKQGRSTAKVAAYIESLFPGNKAVMFLTARASLFHVLQSLRLQDGDEVLVQGFTCEAVVLPVLKNKLKPIYVDIEKETYSMDLSDLEKKLTPHAKVLILQHSFSYTPTHREEIIAFAQKHNLYIIEDLAHGFQTGITSGHLKNHVFLLSFGRSKFFSSVFGGCIMTSDNEILERLQVTQTTLSYPSCLFMFRVLLYKISAVLIKSLYDIYVGKLLHKILFKTGIIIPEITKKEKQGMYDNFLDASYPNGLAYLLLKQLENFEKKQEQRKHAVSEYLIHTKQKSNNDLSLLRFPLLVNNRDALLKSASMKNIFLGKWYDQPVAPKSLSLENVGYIKGMCPVGEYVSQRIINLPTLIEDNQIKKIIGIIHT